MKLLGQVETYIEMKDSRLEHHAISLSAEQELTLTVLEGGRVLILVLSTAKHRLSSKVVSWGSEINNVFCDGGGKCKTWKPEEREAKIKELTNLALYILDRI